MSTKPEGALRLTKYNKTVGEHRHEALVREAKKQGYKHPGSKSLRKLLNIVPMSFKKANYLRKLLNGRL